METGEKIGFFERLKISIFKFEDYARLAAQKISKAVIYMLILMLVFALCVSAATTYKFSQSLNDLANYISNEIETLQFKDGVLSIVPTNNKDKPIIIENEELPVGKFIIDTSDLEQAKIDEYTEQIKHYTSGIVVLKDKIITKTDMSSITTTMTYKDISQQYKIGEFNKDNIMSIITGDGSIKLCMSFFAMTTIYLFIVYFSTVLIDAIFLAILAYITSVIVRVRLKPAAAYNIAVYSLSLPVILNLAYIIANILTGFVIEYFQVVYTAIASIYVVATVLIIRSDVIKKQAELNRIMSEQEKVRQEMERKKQEEKEEAEREKTKKEEQEKEKKEKEQEKKKDKETKREKGSGKSEGEEPA